MGSFAGVPFTKLPNNALEALCGAKLGGRSFSVVMAIIRMTAGYHKDTDRISSRQIAALVGTSDGQVRTLLSGLVAKGIVTSEGGRRGRIARIGIEWDTARWDVDVRKSGHHEPVIDARDPGHVDATARPDFRTPGAQDSGQDGVRKSGHTKETKKLPKEIPSSDSGFAQAMSLLEARSLADLLGEKIQADTGLAPPRSIEAWASKISTIDAPEAEVRRVIEWIFSAGNTGDFAFIVQDAAALAEKFPKIALKVARTAQSNRSGGCRRTSGGGSGTADALRERQEAAERLFAEGEITAPTLAALSAAKDRWAREGRLSAQRRTG